MNRLIAKVLSGLNAVLFVVIAIIIPMAGLSSGNANGYGILFFASCVIVGLIVCGGVAFLATITEQLIEINQKLGKSPVVPAMTREEPTNNAKYTYKCLQCGELNTGDATVCRRCGKPM